MSGGSGILDVERRVELAVLERVRGFTEILDLVKDKAPTSIVHGNDASKPAVFPTCYVEAFNFAEFGRHTGNYMGGVRLGGMTFKDDDQGSLVSRAFLGAFKSWAQQVDLVSLLNGTTSANAFASRVWFFASELNINGDFGNVGFITESTRNTNVNEAVQEITMVCAPNRP